MGSASCYSLAFCVLGLWWASYPRLDNISIETTGRYQGDVDFSMKVAAELLTHRETCSADYSHLRRREDEGFVRFR